MNGFEMILPFLKPIEHLILDDSISEVMVNGPDRMFIEKQGFLQQVPGVSIGEKSRMVAVKNIARGLGGDISESKPILDSRLPDCSRVAAIIYTLRDFTIHEDSPETTRHLSDEQERPRTVPSDNKSQSENDWAYAKRALARGDDPEVVIQRIADYRANDKHDPKYYARLTVTRAAANLRQLEERSPKPINEVDPSH
jgi:hypothetical protein